MAGTRRRDRHQLDMDGLHNLTLLDWSEIDIGGAYRIAIAKSQKSPVPCSVCCPEIASRIISSVDCGDCIVEDGG